MSQTKFIEIKDYADQETRIEEGQDQMTVGKAKEVKLVQQLAQT